ncbi:pyridoxamine 5'-phosphate oxidase family protein [Aquipuribacter sp. MA13-13]|uniref:pyridoxamine 5'-phosphate oxidase family protein n=1 Tax=Aquipuribacter sp. MA13-13 TaxID=3440840 RepID=UPI003EEA764C
MGQPRIETLTRPQCVALLRQAQVGRVAFVDPGADPADAAPHVVPVAFVVDGVGPGPDVEVVVRTTAGSRLARAAPDRLVTFEADEVCAGSREGWSVVVTGRASRETDEVRSARLAGRLQAWAPGFKTQWLRIPLQQVSGRRLVSVERVIELPDAPAPRWREPRGWAPPTRTAAEYATDFDGR